ncbi:FHA domain-containing protein [Flavisolibacter sp. BT320]|nr:FHA domain-containing protein [Flavisolibacter longurius]
MEKADALDFIGLKEPITEEAVIARYKERFNYFQMLYSNAPNKVIEKIQQQNLEKLNKVKKILLEEIAAKKSAFNKQFSEPAVQAEPKVSAEPDKKSLVGWLIVHTENRKTETFSLFEGINFIGRKKKEEDANWIVLSDDPFVSRTHAFIKAKRNNEHLQFVLYDGDGSKPSVNGIYLNGKETRINQFCSLQENDTIQIGSTKLVFRIRKDEGSISAEVVEVMNTDFIRTIDIK